FFHGECVFIGMLLATIISYNKGNIDYDTKRIIFDVISKYDIPVLPSDLDIEKVISYTKNDKKVIGNKVKFILLKNIGEAYIDMEVSDEDMRLSLKELLNIKNYGEIK
ncbi:MAG: 3-dehydroquinate synthase, partial [Lachnospiraceae bacterium]|nr:3-dehydroquinate synthase [Lachnospiraceae bacterium]